MIPAISWGLGDAALCPPGLSPPLNRRANADLRPATHSLRCERPELSGSPSPGRTPGWQLLRPGRVVFSRGDAGSLRPLRAPAHLVLLELPVERLPAQSEHAGRDRLAPPDGFDHPQ